MKRFSLTLLLIATLLNARAELSYRVNWDDMTCTLLGGQTTGQLHIPSVAHLWFYDAFDANGEPIEHEYSFTVTAIGDDAFKGCSGLTGSLSIPNTVKTIGQRAFLNCSGLTGSLIIPNSVVAIGELAFRGCSGFTGSLSLPQSITLVSRSAFAACSGFTGSLTIPESVTEIGSEAFNGCKGFNGRLTIPESVTYIGNSAFNQDTCFTELHWYARMCDYTGAFKFSNLKQVVIGDKVEIIPKYFLSGSNVSGSLTIPNSVTTIGESAFYNCSGFTGSLTIPNSVTEIRRSAFSGCSGFTGTLTIPESVDTIIGGAFSHCSGFTSLNWNARHCSLMGGLPKAQLERVTIGDKVELIPKNFVSGSKVAGQLILPESLIEIGEKAFYNCSGLTGSLTIPESVITIGNSAFSGCTGFSNLNWNARRCGSMGDLPKAQLERLSIGDKVELIPKNFVSGSNVTGQLILPKTLKEIGGSAFSGCNGLTGNLIIPDSVTTIGGSAFYNCSGFTGSLIIGNSVTEIGSSAFSGCGGFTGSLTIPNSVNTIASTTFYNCSGFTGTLNIPNSVTTIGNEAFYGCSGFTGSLTIPNSVTTIAERAFSICRGFTGSLTIGNSVTTIGSSAFSGCSGFTGTLTIGNSVTSIGEYVFYGCSGFTGSLTIGDSVTTIAYGAFSGCSGFTGLNWNARRCSSMGGLPKAQLERLSIGDKVELIPSGFVSGSKVSGQLILPATLKEIGDDAFYNCSGFTGSLAIPNSVTTIGPMAFWHCSGFNEKLIISSSLTEIAGGTFTGCSGFTGTLSIPNSVTTIGNGAFSGCSGFTGSLAIPNSVTYIGWDAFYGCSGFNEKLIISSSLTEIAGGTFYGCSGFTGSLTIPEKVKTIGEGAFYGCCGFTGSLTIGNSVISIGKDAFYDCASFTGKLTIGENLQDYHDAFGYSTRVGPSHFRSFEYNAKNCPSFRIKLKYGASVEIGNKVEVIPNNFISESKVSGSLDIPNSVTVVGDYAFSYCSGFDHSLTIGETVSIIGQGAFTGCSGFTGLLNIGESVEIISDYAFRGCSGINGLIIPQLVDSIGKQAFEGFKALGWIRSQIRDPRPVRMGEKVFDKVPKETCTLYVPDGKVNHENVIDIYRVTPQWSDFFHIKNTFHTVTGLAFEQQNLNLRKGHRFVIRVYITPEDATIKQLLWSSSDTTVAVVDSLGMVTGVNPGTAVITAGTTDGSDIVASATVTVDDGGDIVVGDIDGSGVVDVDDLNIVINIMLRKASMGQYPSADVNGDGVVDVDDLNLVINIMLHKVKPKYFEEGGLNYVVLDGGSVALAAGTYSGEIEIPATVKHDGVTYNVTTVGKVFQYNTMVTKLKLPKSVTTLPEGCFACMASLRELDIPNVENLPDLLCDNCTALTTLTLGEGVHWASAHMTRNCKALTKVTMLYDGVVGWNAPSSFGDIFNPAGYKPINNEIQSQATLYIPCGTLEAYRTKISIGYGSVSLWNKFGSYEELESTGGNGNVET